MSAASSCPQLKLGSDQELGGALLSGTAPWGRGGPACRCGGAVWCLMTAGRPLSPRDVRRQGDPGLTSPRLSRMEKPQLCHPCSASGHWPCGITWHLPFRRGGGPAAATQRPLGLLYHPPPRPHPGGQLVRPGQGPLGRVHGDPGHGWTVTLRPVLSLGLGFQPSSPGPMSVQG